MKRVTTTDFIRAADQSPEPTATGPRAEELRDLAQPPWASADPRVRRPMVLHADERLDAMLKYIADNTPRTSKHGFAIEAVREAAERTAAELFRRLQK